jgi:chromosome segregation ATPase
MNALSDLEQDREQIAQLRSENELAAGRIDHLQGQVGELENRLAEVTLELRDVTDQLQSTSRALHLVSTSRLMRHTALVRRIYYRLYGSRDG